MHDLTDETRYRLLKYLAAHPDATQRELARELGVSVGKINYCVRALVNCGWIKLQNFRNSDAKSAYAYVLTPNGFSEKMNLTSSFLRRKIAEFDLLSREIVMLTAEVNELEQVRDHG